MVAVVMATLPVVMVTAAAAVTQHNIFIFRHAQFEGQVSRLKFKFSLDFWLISFFTLDRNSKLPKYHYECIIYTWCFN